ncbi:MAG: DUF4159 domain-containing protein [Melioribacteraceae bacterium]|jgi:hypothetical protein|nr:DUF4159 domain-containing protein [Melioribacteraceae bacterium]
MNKFSYKTILVIMVLFFVEIFSQSKSGFQIARLKYSGGGDWYNDPSAEVNLLNFVKNETTIKVNPEYVFVEVSSDDIFNFPFLFITGHGNIVFSESEVKRLKTYIERGGFIYIDDDYGMDKPIRREFKKVFPNQNFIELPFNHKIYHSLFDFEFGPPKTHEHNNKPPQGFGLFVGERLAVYYTFESNPSDGWVDKEVHNNPENKRLEALRFGTNIIIYSLTN